MRDAAGASVTTSGRRGRFALAIVALALLLIGASSPLFALLLDASAPSQSELDDEAARARLELGERIGAEVRRARRLAETALERAAGVTGRSALFTRLGEVDLGAGTGVVLEDRYGRALAWAGRPHDPDLPPPLEGASVVESPNGVDLLFRLSVPLGAAADADVAPVSAVARIALDARPPEPSGSTASTAALVRARYDVADVRILPARDTSGEGDLVVWDSHVPLARVQADAVTPDTASARSPWTRLVPVFGIAGLVGCVLVAWLSGPLRAVPFVILFVGMRLTGAFAPFGPTAYAGDLGDGPVHVLLAGLAGFLLLRSLAHVPPGRLTSAGGLALVAVVAVAGHVGLDHVVRDVVANSTPVLFPADRVVPGVPALCLLSGVLLLCGGVVLFLARLVERTRGDATASHRALLAAAAGAVVAPWSIGGEVVLAVLVVVCFAAATALAAVRPGSPVRAAVVPLLLALGLFGPLETRLVQSERDRVLAAADASATLPRDTALQRVDSALDRLLEAGALTAAVEDRFLPPGLASRLWDASQLASLGEPAGVLLRPALGYGPAETAGAGLPPADWLPAPEPPGEATVLASRPGRGAGADGRWARATVPLRAGDTLLGSVEVVLAWRRPNLADLDGLDVLRTGTRAATRGDPDVSLHRYDAQGGLLDGSAVADADGALLAPESVRAVIRDGAPAWLPPGPGHEERGLLVRPVERDDGRRGADVFAYGTRGTVGRLLAATQAALLGAFLAGLALLADAGTWWARLRERIAHQLVLLLVALAALPLLLLAVVSHRLIVERAESDFEAGLRQSAALAEVAVRQQLTADAPQLDDEALRRLAYARGHHLGVYGGGDRATLLAVSEPALARPDVLPTRLPGTVFRSSVLLERPFVRQRADRTERGLDVGFAPLRSDDGQVIGAIAVPYPEARRTRDRELAGATLTVLGFSLVALVLAALMGTWLARRLVSPLQSLSAGAARVAKGELGEPVPRAGGGELGQVIDAFNRMIEELEASQRRLVAAEKESAWRDMARQVAHEVKNPLTPMRLAAQHLKRARDDGASDFDRILDRSVDVIVRQTEKLQRIVTDFRDFARLPQVRREPVDLARLLRDATDLYRQVPGVTLEVRIEDGVPPVEANPEEFERVLVNLLGNAVEAFDGAPGRLVAELSQADDGRVVLRIEDDGPGIPAEALPRLFEPSFSTKSGGTGLGLAICKRAIDDLGGRIEITSPATGGTVVRIDLPAHGATGGAS